MPNVHGWERVRSWPVYTLAFSVPVSIAAISVSKLALVLLALGSLLIPSARARWKLPPARLSHWVALAMLGALAFSLSYTSAPLGVAVVDLGKYAKLLLLVLIPFLLVTRRQAWVALGWLGGMQVFILLSSCALALGLHLPWVTDPVLASSNSVFHEYLHQSIMTTGFAATLWHLRHEWNRPGLRYAALALCGLALFNVVFLLKGRSGWVSVFVVVSAAAYWASPGRWRIAAVLAPMALVALSLLVSPQFRARADLVVTEAGAFAPGNPHPSSTSARLNFWYRSVQAIAERPLTGFGAGSWGQEYRRLDGAADPWYKGSGGNPHQEFLLWGVLLGLGGMGLLLALLLALWHEANSLSLPCARATKSVILMLVVTGLFNSVLYDGEIGDYFCLMLGLLMALGRVRPIETPSAEIPPGANA